MTRAQLTALGVSILAAVGLVGGVVLLREGETTVPDTAAKAELRDGGLVYVVPATARLEDGEVVAVGEEKILAKPACVRRPKGAKPEACLRRMKLLGAEKESDVDFGELNRFPAAEAVGEGCQPVACVVVAGQDSDAEESTMLEAAKLGR